MSDSHCVGIEPPAYTWQCIPFEDDTVVIRVVTPPAAIWRWTQWLLLGFRWSKIPGGNET